MRCVRRSKARRRHPSVCIRSALPLERSRGGSLVAGRTLPDGAAFVYARSGFPCRGLLRAGGFVAVPGSRAGRGGGRRKTDSDLAPRRGKTTLYASLAGSDGLVVANEVNRQRAAVLADNVRKWGLGNVAVTVNEPAQIAVLEGWFDIVAVDAPVPARGCFAKYPRHGTSGARTM